MSITRSNVEGIVGFIAANLDGATDLEREALAAYQADPEAAIERALTETEPGGTVETFVMFTPEQLRNAGAHYLAEQARAASSAESPELAEVRAEIRRTEIYLGSSAYYSAPWEHQHNVLNSLNLLRAREVRLAAELATDEARTADLTARAEATGAPQLAALLYVAVGDAILDMPEPAPAVAETPATQNLARMELRAATVADIVNRLSDSDYEWTSVTALGWGMGPAQLGIHQAVTAAAEQGLVILERWRGSDRVRLAA